MKIALIVKPGYLDTGIGRYCKRLAETMQALGHHVIIVHPLIPLPGWMIQVIKKWIRIDFDTFFSNYPIWIRYPDAEIYHLTSQNLATLMFFCPPPGKTVITVHDIIPWLTRKDPELRVYRYRLEAWMDRLALNGLTRGDAILTDSKFTKYMLDNNIELRNIPVSTIYLGIQFEAGD